MEHVTARRRLVKSPPELWAEVSDPATLAQRLGELGEIRITRTLPETTVAWEAERAAGIIEIEGSGWGTRVSLSAAPAGGGALEPPERVETELRVVEERPVRIEIAPPEPEPAARSGFLSRLFGSAPREPEPPPRPEVLELRICHAVCACRVPERAPAAGAIEAPALRDLLEAVLDDLGAAHHRPFSRA
jgi:hypothetical protein